MPENSGLWLPEDDWGAVRDALYDQERRLRDVEMAAAGAACLIVKGANQLIPSSVTTFVTWDAPQINGAQMWQAGDPTKIVCRVAGLYYAYAQLTWQAAAAGGQWTSQAGIGQNGVPGLATDPWDAELGQPTGFNYSNEPGGLWRLQPGDYLQAWVSQNAFAGGLNLLGSAGHLNAKFGVFRIGA